MSSPSLLSGTWTIYQGPSEEDLLKNFPPTELTLSLQRNGEEGVQAVDIQIEACNWGSGRLKFKGDMVDPFTRERAYVHGSYYPGSLERGTVSVG